MKHAGKWLIFGVFATALVLASASVWYHYSASRRAIEFWGGEAARGIARSESVEVLRLADQPPDAPAGVQPDFKVGRIDWWVVERVDASNAPGVAHLRAGLLEDANFDWSVRGAAGEVAWSHALRFITPGSEFTVLIETPGHRVALAGRDQSISAAPIAAGLESFLAEQFAGKPSPGSGH